MTFIRDLLPIWSLEKTNADLLAKQSQIKSSYFTISKNKHRRKTPSAYHINTQITLWWTNIAMENHHAINGKIHYFYGHFPLLFVGSPKGICSFDLFFFWFSSNVGLPKKNTFLPHLIAILKRHIPWFHPPWIARIQLKSEKNHHEMPRKIHHCQSLVHKNMFIFMVHLSVLKSTDEFRSMFSTVSDPSDVQKSPAKSLLAANFRASGEIGGLRQQGKWRKWFHFRSKWKVICLGYGGPTINHSDIGVICTNLAIERGPHIGYGGLGWLGSKFRKQSKITRTEIQRKHHLWNTFSSSTAPAFSGKQR